MLANLLACVHEKGILRDCRYRLVVKIGGNR